MCLRSLSLHWNLPIINGQPIGNGAPILQYELQQMQVSILYCFFCPLSIVQRTHRLIKIFSLVLFNSPATNAGEYFLLFLLPIVQRTHRLIKIFSPGPLFQTTCLAVERGQVRENHANVGGRAAVGDAGRGPRAKNRERRRAASAGLWSGIHVQWFETRYDGAGWCGWLVVVRLVFLAFGVQYKALLCCLCCLRCVFCVFCLLVVLSVSCFEYQQSAQAWTSLNRCITRVGIWKCGMF